MTPARSLSFIAIDRDGSPTQYGFAAADWGETPELVLGRCNGLEIGGNGEPTSVPAQCDGINWVSFPGEDSTEVFWTTRNDENITQFEVQFNGIAIQTCATVSRRCSVALP